MNVRKLAQFSGICGLVIIIFGLLCRGLLLNEAASGIAFGHFVLGGFLLIVFVASGGLRFFRRSSARKATLAGVGSIAYTILVAVILLLINKISLHLDYFSYDSTQERVFTLAPQTQEVLSRLTAPVTLRGFYLEGKMPPESQTLIDLFIKVSPKLSWEIIDPEKQPLTIKEYGVERASTIVLSQGKDFERRDLQLSEPLSEQDLVNALLRLTTSRERKVYYLSGHGEPEISGAGETAYAQLREALASERIKVEELFLARAKSIPTDAEALFIAAPRTRLLEGERQLINNFLQNSGNVFFLAEPNTTSDIAELLKPLGVEIGSDIVVDETITPFEGKTFHVEPTVKDYAKHSSMRDFRKTTQFSIASSVRAGPTPAGVKLTELAFTGVQSWAERDLGKLLSDTPIASLDISDLRGPVPIAIAIEGAQKSEVSPTENHLPASTAQIGRVFVIGDADFVNNTYLRQLFNRDFILNAFHWVLGEDEQVSIRSRTMQGSLRKISPEQMLLLFLVAGVFLPQIILLFGLAIWWFRLE